MTPYEFAILRFVPRPYREEFANCGIVMWLPGTHRILFRIDRRYGHFGTFVRDFDGGAFSRILESFETHLSRVAEAVRAQNRELFGAALPERLEQILSVIFPASEGALRWSSVMAGISSQPEARLDHLFDEFVVHPGVELRDRQSEYHIERAVKVRLKLAQLDSRLKHNVTLSSGAYSYDFMRGWNNDVPQFLEPISFDYLEKKEIVDKANRWLGRVICLGESTKKFAITAIVALPAEKSLWKAYEQAVHLLRNSSHFRDLVPQSDFDTVIPRIEEDLAHHPDAT